MKADWAHSKASCIDSQCHFSFPLLMPKTDVSPAIRFERVKVPRFTLVRLFEMKMLIQFVALALIGNMLEESWQVRKHCSGNTLSREETTDLPRTCLCAVLAFFSRLSFDLNIFYPWRPPFFAQSANSFRFALMSMKLGLSSKIRKGFAAPPSFSMLPAHTFHAIGFNGSVPRIRPKQANTTANIVSSLISNGRSGET